VTPAFVLSFTSVADNPVLFVPSTVTVAGATVIPTDGTSSVAEADFVASAAEVPVSVTVILLFGGVAGAAYVVLVPFAGDTVPQPGEHAAPFCSKVQLRFPPVGSLFTVPLIINVAATCTVEEVVERDTESAGMVIIALADFVGSITEVALSVTVRSLAGGPGAVYVVCTPLTVAPGETEPHELAAHETVHFTPPALTSFTTVAVNGRAVLSSNIAVVLSSETLIGRGGGCVAEAPPHPKLAAAKKVATNTPRTGV
jgi:hypothetical protein